MAPIDSPEVLVARTASGLAKLATRPQSSSFTSRRSTMASMTRSLSPMARSRSSSKLPAMMRVSVCLDIRAGGLAFGRSPSARSAGALRAATGCGSCDGEIQEVGLAACGGQVRGDARPHGPCPQDGGHHSIHRFLECHEIKVATPAVTCPRTSCVRSAVQCRIVAPLPTRRRPAGASVGSACPTRLGRGAAYSDLALLLAAGLLAPESFAPESLLPPPESALPELELPELEPPELELSEDPFDSDSEPALLAPLLPDEE